MANTTKNLFPLGIATGAAHCNRKHERETLKTNVAQAVHTWLWARRRMGKTSLIEQVMVELARQKPPIPSVKLDLNLVHDAESLELKLRDAAAELSLQLLPDTNRAQRILFKAFTRFAPEFSVGGAGLKMRLQPTLPPAPGIAEVLLALDNAAAAARRKGLIVLDEFQQIGSLTYGKNDLTLEGAVRHAAERSAHIAYVFAGSERHLLADMFESPDRPLYGLCRKMSLSRITAVDYRRFLNKAAKARWGATLIANDVDQILNLTERHPYYVNALCSLVWASEQLPTRATIERCWRELVSENLAVVADRVRALSATQRAMLIGIATHGEVPYPTSRTFLAEIRLAASTGSAAKDVLEKEDLIAMNERDAWQLVNPIMNEYIRST